MEDEYVFKKRDPSAAHYVSNKELFAAYLVWYADIEKAVLEGTDEPPVPRYIAECMVKICVRLGYKANFINYSYREEMIGDAIENVVRTARKFKPEKSENPFSFITTIAFNAFLRRIAMEKRQTYIKGKLIEELPIEDLISVGEHGDDDGFSPHQQFLEFLRDSSYIVGTPLPQSKKKVLSHDDIEHVFDKFLDEVNSDDPEE
jgi:DNA-directed RNA polymerase specialized sigma24 family protein